MNEFSFNRSVEFRTYRLYSLLRAPPPLRKNKRWGVLGMKLN